MRELLTTAAGYWGVNFNYFQLFWIVGDESKNLENEG